MSEGKIYYEYVDSDTGEHMRIVVGEVVDISKNVYKPGSYFITLEGERAEPELKPCPFCGSDNSEHTDEAGWIAFESKPMPSQKLPYWRVRCTQCGNGTELWSDKVLAIAAWNRRTP